MVKQQSFQPWNAIESILIIRHEHHEWKKYYVHICITLIFNMFKDDHDDTL